MAYHSIKRNFNYLQKNITFLSFLFGSFFFISGFTASAKPKSSFTNDAGIRSIILPDSICSGYKLIFVNMQNYGDSTLYRDSIYYSVNDFKQGAYSWSGLLKKDSVDSSISLGLYNFKSAGVYAIKAWTTVPNGVNDSNPANDTSVFIIKVFATPVASTGKDRSICTGGSVFIGDTLTPGDSYSWSSNPAGFISSAAGDTVSPTVTTTYYLTESNEHGCSKSDSVVITVVPFPLAKTGSSKTICSGANTLIGDTAITGHIYSWASNPSGFTSPISNPMVSPTIATTYYLTETSQNICSKSDSVIIKTNPLPLAKTGGKKSVCPGTITTVGDSAVIGDTYYWIWTDGSSVDTTSSITFTASTTTTYYLQETITATGCKKADSAVITVNPPPRATTGKNKALCLGDSTSIGDTAISGDNYSWISKPSGYNNKNANPDISPSVTTTYYLTEQITATGCSASDSVVITINPLPDAHWTALVSNNEVKFSPITTSAKSYLWRFGNGDSSIAQSPVDTYKTNGKFNTKLLVTNTFGCKNEYDSNIVINTITGIANLATNAFSLKISPNPFTTVLTVYYNLPQNQNVQLIITGITGKQITVLAIENQKAGQYTYSFDVSKYNMPAGIYFLKMVAGNEALEEKIIRVQ